MASKVGFAVICRRNLLTDTRYKTFRLFNGTSNVRHIANIAPQLGYGDGKTDFGFQDVDKAEKQEKVNQVFDKVAKNYDLMNDVMSLGLHKKWKDHLIGQLAPEPGTRLLDVAGGTGDVAFRFLQYAKKLKPVAGVETDDMTSDSSGDEKPQTHVTVCDINPSMLEICKEKAEELGYDKEISYLVSNAENLENVESNSYDAYTIAFGIRNCTDRDKVMKEAHRVLKPGGRFMCMEFGRVSNFALRSLYDAYSFQAIPPLGQIFVRDWKSYQYLVESIRRFPPQEIFLPMVRKAGFKAVSHENLLGGAVVIYSGFKIS